ncbi:MAG: hypothetical protein GFH27_549319n110 [Chloroflexi bacterium AL-W]|nr:hypothetical protein [Chloroflexi bacterium AL-N1]NOK71273.1 hypothetical protein [Chloroflexi bacterium AL-N10]NOK77648.1 hypothetical protein [Chloroflexi bacterium AL-N5]NOK84499.1 hypothetical protein [Chloroflexi bacterium AL-W]NOK92950.1 hypothetical protein [Chloroflexi bacterium AL-N15]
MKTSLRHIGSIVFLCSVVILSLFVIQSSIPLIQAAQFDRFADAVLGQPEFTSSLENNSGLSAASLNYPWGLAVDQQTGRLYIADTSNHRVLGWPSAAAFTNQEAADLVIGQSDFTSNSSDQGQPLPNAATLDGPIDVAVDYDGNLYVADFDNHRILVYEDPTEHDAVADWVLGQPSFFDEFAGAGRDGLHFPWGMAIDSAGNLYVADSENNRVLQYDTPLTTDTLPDQVFGQPNFESTTRNNGGVSAVSLSGSLDLALDWLGNLYVADTGNGRVLIYRDPLNTDTTADEVIGQPNFTSNAVSDPGPDTFSWLTGITVDRYGNVYTVEISRDRVMVFETLLYSDKIADRVLGQPDFTTVEDRDRETNAATLLEPIGVAVDTGNNIVVADMSNSRVLRYDTVGPHPIPEITEVTPATIPVGSANLMLTVTGQNFASDTVLFWDDMPLETTVVDYTEVTATIDAAYLREAGTANLTIRNPAPGGQQSAPWLITIGSATTPTPSPSSTPTVFLPAIIR